MRYRRRRPEEREQFGVPLQQRKGPPPGPEILPWYWHPGREGAQPPPAAFAEQLKRIDPDLAVCFNPVLERWVLWVKNPRIQSEFCRGWQLLILWEHPVTKAYLPLNELMFHNIYVISAGRYANAREYFDKVESNISRQREQRAKDYDRERQAEQSELADFTRISSAAPGNRAALHHDGTLIPSQGHANHLRETRKWRLPSEMLKAEKDEKEKAAYGR